MTLDIVVTHYNEPYHIVKPLFDMLSLQRKVDYCDFRVILVHDGEDRRIPELSARSFPFEFTEMTIPHKGVSAARNAGLDHSDAEWVMFCDCDDTFTNIYAINEISHVLSDDKFDLLWFPFIFESPYFKEQRIVGNNIWAIHGKIFRRSFLVENNLRFCEDLRYSEDMAFVSVANEVIDKKRTGRINTTAPMYVYIKREGSTMTAPENRYPNMVGLFRKQAYMAEELRKRGLFEPAKYYPPRAMTDAYLILCRTDIEESREEFDLEAQEFYKKYRDEIRSTDKKLFETMLNGALNEFTHGLNQPIPVPIPFDKWLNAWVNAHHLDD